MTLLMLNKKVLLKKDKTLIIAGEMASSLGFARLLKRYSRKTITSLPVRRSINTISTNLANAVIWLAMSIP